MNGVWVLRHGESTANVERRIVSVPGPRAMAEVGLTAWGREQARGAGQEALSQGVGSEALILTSDFARARETAELFAAVLGAAAPQADLRLRERCFGIFDEGSTTAYEGVWAADRERVLPGHGVETVTAVARRIGEVLHEAEEHSAEHPVVLVAHGDVLQIALALAAGTDPHEHRRAPQLGNAELRRAGIRAREVL